MSFHSWERDKADRRDGDRLRAFAGGPGAAVSCRAFWKQTKPRGSRRVQQNEHTRSRAYIGDMDETFDFQGECARECPPMSANTA